MLVPMGPVTPAHSHALEAEWCSSRGLQGAQSCNAVSEREAQRTRGVRLAATSSSQKPASLTLEPGTDHEWSQNMESEGRR